MSDRDPEDYPDRCDSLSIIGKAYIDGRDGWTGTIVPSASSVPSLSRRRYGGLSYG